MSQGPVNVVFVVADRDALRARGGPALRSPAHLAELLCNAVAALEREARAHRSGGSAADAVAARDAFAAARVDLQHAAQVFDDHAAAAAGAGRVPLPSPSADVDAALDALAVLIADGCAEGRPLDAVAAAVGNNALCVADAVAFCAPQRAAALARHSALTRALVAALAVGARGGEDGLALTLGGAMSGAAKRVGAAILTHAEAAAWRASESGASLRALAAALARDFGALERSGGADVLRAPGGPTPCEEISLAAALVAALRACPAAQRPGLCASLLEQEGFASTLCGCVARGAAAVRAPGAATFSEDDRLPGNGALALAGELMRSNADRLLAATPALLERVADVVVAGAPWYAAVCAALGPAGGAGSGAGGNRTLARLVASFNCLEAHFWKLAASALYLAPLRALTDPNHRHGADGGALIARLAPALLQLAEAAQALAGAPPGRGLELLTDGVRVRLAETATEALRVVEGVAMARVRGRAPSPVDSAPSALLTALVRLATSEPPLLAAGEGAARAVFDAHCRLRARATQALACMSVGPDWPPVAALLAASPALLGAIVAAFPATESERRFTSRADAAAVARVAERRAMTAGLLAHLAFTVVEDGGCDVSWLRGLAT